MKVTCFMFSKKDLPYNYSEKELNQLREATPTEIDLFMSGERFQAIKSYCSRNKINDIKLVAWFFLSVSKKAYDIKHTMQNVFGIKDRLTAKELVEIEEMLYLNKGKWKYSKTSSKNPKKDDKEPKKD